MKIIKLSLLLAALVAIFPELNYPKVHSEPSSFSAIGFMEANAVASPVEAFEGHAKELYDQMELKAAKLDYSVFSQALSGMYNLLAINKISKPEILSIVDFSKPSTEKRLFVLNLETGKLLYKTLVAHGKNTGDNWAKYFSNEPGSFKSSLGFYKCAETYQGEHGYSLRLDGLDKGLNHKARERAIVLHGADYVCNEFCEKQGRLGRSFGCPSVPMQVHDEIISDIKNGSCLFIYAPNQGLENSSVYLDKQKASSIYQKLRNG